MVIKSIRKNKITDIKSKQRREVVYEIRMEKTMTSILVMALIASIAPQIFVEAKSVPNCKSLCGAALKAIGGSKHLKYTSTSTLDFGALSSSARKKVKRIQYVCDAKEVYSLCVISAKNSSNAKSLLSTLKKFKKGNCKSNYLSDYSATEKRCLKMLSAEEK